MEPGNLHGSTSAAVTNGRLYYTREQVVESERPLIAVQFADMKVQAYRERLDSIRSGIFREATERQPEWKDIDVRRQDTEEIEKQCTEPAMLGFSTAINYQEESEKLKDYLENLQEDITELEEDRERLFQALEEKNNLLLASEKEMHQLQDEQKADQAALDIALSIQTKLNEAREKYLNALKVDNHDLYVSFTSKGQKERDFISLLQGEIEQLKNALSYKSQQLNSYSANQEDAYQLKKEIEHLRKNNSQLKHDIGSWHTAHDRLKTDNNQLRTSISRISQEAEESRHLAAQNYTACQRLDTELSSVNLQRTELHKQIKESKAQLMDQSELQDRLATETANAKKYYDWFQNRSAETKELTRVTEQWDLDYRSLQTHSEKEKNDLSEKLRQLQYSLQMSESKLSELHVQLDELVKEKAGLEKKIRFKSSYIKGQKTVEEAIKKEQKSNTEKIVQLEVKLTEAERKLSESLKNQDDIKKQKTTSEARLKGLELEIASNLRGHDQEKIKISEANILLRSKLEKEKENIERIESELETTKELAEEAKKLKNEVIEAQRCSKKAASRNIRLQREARKFEEEFQFADKKLVEVQSQFDQLKSDNAQLRVEFDRKTQEISTLERRVVGTDQLQQQLDARKTDIQNITKDKLHAVAQLRDITEQKSSAERQLREEQRKSDKQKVELETHRDRISELMSRIRGTESKEKNVNEKLRVANEEIHTANTRLNQLEREKAELESRLSSQVTSLTSKASTDVAAKTQEIEDLQAKVAGLRQEVIQSNDKLEQEAGAYQSEKHLLEKQLASLINEKSQLQEKQNNASSKLKRTKEKLASSESTQVEVETKLRELEVHLQTHQRHLEELQKSHNKTLTENSKLTEEVFQLKETALKVDVATTQNQMLQDRLEKLQVQRDKLEQEKVAVQEELHKQAENQIELEPIKDQHKTELLGKDLVIQQLRIQLKDIKGKYDKLDQQFVDQVMAMDGPDGGMPSLPPTRTTFQYYGAEDFSLTADAVRDFPEDEPSHESLPDTSYMPSLSAHNDVVSRAKYDELLEKLQEVEADRDGIFEDRSKMINAKWKQEDQEENLAKANMKITELQREIRNIKADAATSDSDLQKAQYEQIALESEIKKLKRETSKFRSELQDAKEEHESEISEAANRNLETLTRATRAESKTRELEAQSQLEREERVALAVENNQLKAFIENFTGLLKANITDPKSRQFIDRNWLETIQQQMGRRQEDGEYIETPSDSD
ncbi:hypothetical protein EOPP23_08625 [Endozoicomonas sp. OPT23]|uniref:hypothetical protein n=1 Tax=Endozoicomonas sp. OPT23 TaxID=2072845 RepID=UPI00129C06E9|nr:hypothetical protein [Endozoicomonas sp. OPT23]MRI33046.1 hypothetical protein [Endozoicomonas sp. OPT23]